MSVATVSQNAVIDTANSSTTVLAAGATFTGRAEDVSIYAAVNAFVFTDQTGTLFIEFSIDGTNWDKSNSYAVSASTANNQSVAPSAQFVRIRYVNDGTPQTSFRLQTFYQPIAPAASSSVMGTVTSNQGTAAAIAGAWPVKITDGTNTTTVTGASALKVDGSAVTQPISAASLPLPTGAATSANQTTLGSQTTKINDGTNTAAVSAANALKVDGSAVTQPVSGTVTADIGTTNGLALDATLTGGTAKSIVRGGAKGATTAADVTSTAEGTDHQALDVQIYHGGTAKDPTQIRALTSSDVVTSAQGTAAALAGYWPVRVTDGTNTMPTMDVASRAGFQKITDGTNTASVTGASALKVDGSAVTQPVSGTVTANIGTTNGLALDATLTGGTQKTRITDGTNDASVTGSNALKVDGSAVTQPISTASLPLPSGAATSANQTTLGSQTTKINDGTNTAAVSAANALKVDGSAVTQPVSGTVTSNQGTANSLANAWSTKLTDGTNGPAAIKAASVAPVSTDPALVVAISPNSSISVNSDGYVTSSAPIYTDGTFNYLSLNTSGGLRVDGSGATQPVSGTVTANQGGTWTVQPGNTANTTPWLMTINQGGNSATVTGSNALKVDGSAVTQPVSATSLPLPTGAATSANQTTLGSQTTKINDGTNTATVTGASALKVDGSATTQPVSGTVTANIGTTNGLALDATLTGGTARNKITDGTNDAAVKAASTAAVATDPALVVAISPNNSVAITAASLPLPTGAATSANQTTLGSQTTKINDGTNTAAVTGSNALKVDGSAVTQPISATSLPLPTGAAQEHVTAGSPHAVRLTDGAAFYDATKTGQLPSALVGGRLDTNLGAWLGSTAPTVGQKTAANSLPTILASDQGALPVNVVGTHANAWSAAVVGAGGNSTAIDCQYTPHISAFGNANGATTISLQVSQDNTNFYTAATVSVAGGGGDFALNVTIGARYIRLQSSQARTITASITGKD